MSLRARTDAIVRPIVFLGQNVVTLLGAVLTTSAGITLVLFWLRELFSRDRVHPYAGILLYLILPGVFLLGLVMMPAGLVWRRARLKTRGELPAEYPAVDFGSRVLQRALYLVLALTVVNVAMMGTASYKGLEYMDSTQFCGQACHTVMQPEYTAYLDSPHSRVACVECHIGPGASWFVRSKLSGTRQVFAVALETYSRPIPSPVTYLRPARETCEQCHWPQRFVGDRFVVRTKFQDDEANTRLTTVLVLKIGGHRAGGVVGIHGRHLSDRSRISYVSTDGRRQVIPRVTYVDDEGKSVEFVSKDLKISAEDLARGERRDMDCIDCHNRPSHAFEMPERALDRAMADGAISPDLPYVKKKAVELLRAEYPDRDTAAARIEKALADYYRDSHPEAYRTHRAQVESAARGVAAIYLKNVFPGMRVTWGVHPNNVGHEDFLGCFRCHDDNHESSDGRTISQDCDACHTILAMEESNPKVLADLGLE
jgi:nitrate/TMAO reductase-like tetraheme cytochrome c subunit